MIPGNISLLTVATKCGYPVRILAETKITRYSAINLPVSVYRDPLESSSGKIKDSVSCKSTFEDSGPREWSTSLLKNQRLHKAYWLKPIVSTT